MVAPFADNFDASLNGTRPRNMTSFMFSWQKIRC
jgi:hypothetical protein